MGVYLLTAWHLLIVQDGCQDCNHSSRIQQGCVLLFHLPYYGTPGLCLHDQVAHQLFFRLVLVGFDFSWGGIDLVRAVCGYCYCSSYFYTQQALPQGQLLLLLTFLSFAVMIEKVLECPMQNIELQS